VGTGPTDPLRIAIDQEGNSDGFAMLRIGLDAATLGSPRGLGAVVGPTGGGGAWPAAGTRSWAVTALTAGGETAIGFPVSANVDVVTKKVTVSWQARAGATGYRLYRTDTPGTFGPSSLAASLGAEATSHLDGGAATTAGFPPVANTTGGGAPAFGAAPPLGTAPITTPALAVGDWAFIWVGRVVPPEASAITNPRRAALVVTEVSTP
jgi:hypothetical protein